MQFKTSVFARVLIVLYLSADSLSHYIPSKETLSSGKKNETAQRERIQICGNALTTMIVEACDGIVGSPNQGQLIRGSIQTKITEDCCDRECPLDYLQNYCGQTPLFTHKKTIRGKLLGRLNPRNRNSGVQVPDIKPKMPNERQNHINRTWPSIQIGTISPEIDKFGGQPIVVVKKNKLNFK